MATLAELRAGKATKSLPTRVRRITLNLDLLAGIQRLEEEKADLTVQMNRKSSEDRDGTDAVRKMAEGAPPRLEEIREELGALYESLRDSEGEILLRGITGGEWQRWKDEHPPREDSVTDKDVAWGLCNATDLLDDLARFVVSWEGEEFAPDDWDGWFRDKVSAGDLRDLVTDVVAMHEMSGVRAPKSSPGSSGIEPGSND